jgi:hypothetical protein
VGEEPHGAVGLADVALEAQRQAEPRSDRRARVRSVRRRWRNGRRAEQRRRGGGGDDERRRRHERDRAAARP